MSVNCKGIEVYDVDTFERVRRHEKLHMSLFIDGLSYPTSLPTSKLLCLTFLNCKLIVNIGGC